MRQIICLLLVPIVQVMTYFQNDYHINPHHATLTWYNKQVFKRFDVVSFKFNRTTTAFNATLSIKRDLSTELTAVVRGYKFVSNEYRPFPINFEIDLCESIDQDTFGLQTVFLRYANLTRCPIKHGNYHGGNIAFDESKFPPHIPKGNYKFDVQTFDKSVHLNDIEVVAEFIPLEHYRYE